MKIGGYFGGLWPVDPKIEARHEVQDRPGAVQMRKRVGKSMVRDEHDLEGVRALGFWL